MTIISQAEGKPWLSITEAFEIGLVLSGMVFAGILSLFGVSLVPVAILCAMVLLLWLAWRYPMKGLGCFLAFIPAYTLTFLLAKFFGPHYIGVFEGGDRVILLLFTLILWRRNGIELKLPDWMLLICFAIAVVRLLISGTVLGLLTDFNFMIAYAAGRVTVLSSEREKAWAKRAVWIVAVISVLGLVEVLYIGEAPRTVLYLAVANGGTAGQSLDAAFHADQYTGLRESATMFGPLQFAPLCMTALILWWVYCQNPVPGAMIAAGLVGSVTRSAWVGTTVALALVAVHMGQTRRLLKYGGLLLALFVAAIPILGLSDYLLSTRSGQDPSRESHQESLLGGLQYTLAHPLGTGPGSIGKWAVKQEENAAGIENTYLTIAAQYGIPALLGFAGFLVSALWRLWREHTQRAYASVGIIAGFGAVMLFAALHDVFPLACWLWFPVGVAIRSASPASQPS